MWFQSVWLDGCMGNTWDCKFLVLPQTYCIRNSGCGSQCSIFKKPPWWLSEVWELLHGLTCILELSSRISVYFQSSMSIFLSERKDLVPFVSYPAGSQWFQGAFFCHHNFIYPFEVFLLTITCFKIQCLEFYTFLLLGFSELKSLYLLQWWQPSVNLVSHLNYRDDLPENICFHIFKSLPFIFSSR